MKLINIKRKTSGQATNVWQAPGTNYYVGRYRYDQHGKACAPYYRVYLGSPRLPDSIPLSVRLNCFEEAAEALRNHGV